MTDLNVAVIGTGNIAKTVGRALAAVDGVRIVAAADNAGDRAERYVAEFGGTACTDYQAMIRRDDVDLVAVTMPTHVHTQPVIDCANAGKHVYVEKPMATTLADCDRMIEAAERNGIHLLVAHTENFITPNREAKRMIASGQVGAPVLVVDTWNKPFLFGTRQKWFTEAAGGGMWYQNGSHMVDRVTYILDTSVVAVKAMIGTRFHPMTAPDTNLVYLHLANNVPVSSVQVNYKDTPDGGVARHEIEIAGEEAMLKIADRRRLYVSRNGEWEEIPLDVQNPFELEVAALRDAIRDGTPLPFTPRRARHIVAVMEAALESSRSGRELLVGD